jgi:hypothetical protein
VLPYLVTSQATKSRPAITTTKYTATQAALPSTSLSRVTARPRPARRPHPAARRNSPANQQWQAHGCRGRDSSPFVSACTQNKAGMVVIVLNLTRVVRVGSRVKHISHHNAAR